MNSTPFVRQYDIMFNRWVILMPKGVPNKRYTPEFKKLVVETMMKEKMSYRETARQFEISNHHRVQDWERIYLTEGPEGLAIERVAAAVRRPPSSCRAGRRRSAGRSPAVTCGERLPKKLASLGFWKTSDASAENAGSSKAEAKTFSGYSSLNRSTAPCHFLLPSEADKQCR